jgi:hypothetical protein
MQTVAMAASIGLVHYSLESLEYMHRWIVGIAALALLGVVGWFCGAWELFAPIRKQNSSRGFTAVGGAPTFDQDMTLTLPPIQNPTFVFADEAPLLDDDIVIGVMVGDQSRAYLREAFDDSPAAHVVYDQLGSMSVAITHCDRKRCTRVLGVDLGTPLEVSVGGWNADENTMELLISGQRFLHLWPEIPLNDVPFVETTWGLWRTVYPDTLVYVAPPVDVLRSTPH